MDKEKLEMMKNQNGFIAALDQSGGSTAKTLKLYGIQEDDYHSEEEMFDLIHVMRTRVMSSKSFDPSKIIGVILFQETMRRQIDGKNTAEFLWDHHILSFLKVDAGLMEEENGVQLMKKIPNLNAILKEAKSHGIFGTKMCSVIHEANEEGIRNVVAQQFLLARLICRKGLVPIIEPEVDIHSPEKEKCEELLLKFVQEELQKLDENMRIMFKFTIPSRDNFYEELMKDSRVVRIVALSGGYPMEEACEKLSHNHGMIASFSRALLESLRVDDKEEEFDQKLATAIDKIYQASIQ